MYDSIRQAFYEYRIQSFKRKLNKNIPKFSECGRLSPRFSFAFQPTSLLFLTVIWPNVNFSKICSECVKFDRTYYYLKLIQLFICLLYTICALTYLIKEAKLFTLRKPQARKYNG